MKKSRWAFYYLITLVFIAAFLSACVEDEKVVRLGEVNSLSHLGMLVKAQHVRISNPGRGWQNITLATDKEYLLNGEEPRFDLVFKGDINQAKMLWIKNFAVDNFSLLLFKGNIFKVKRAANSDAPVVTITMIGQGGISGARSEVITIKKPPFIIARIQFSGISLPSLKAEASAKSFYLKGTYVISVGSGKDTELTDYNTPTDQLLKLLFEIEYPAGKPGSLTGKVYLLDYTAASVSSGRISMDCLYFISID
jgi:hypothetical protein